MSSSWQTTEGCLSQALRNENIRPDILHRGDLHCEDYRLLTNRKGLPHHKCLVTNASNLLEGGLLLDALDGSS